VQNSGNKNYCDCAREVPLPPQMTLDKMPSVSKQRELLSFEPKISIDEGIKKVANRIMKDFGEWLAMIMSRGILK